MVHVGKDYPYWQVTRLYGTANCWPDFGPTEYNYAITNIMGPGTSGIIATGRGILPITWNQGDKILKYRGTIGSWAAQSYTLEVDYFMASSAYPLLANVLLFLGTSLIGQLAGGQVAVGSFSSTDISALWPGWSAVSGSPITSLFLHDLTPVQWTQTPPPPAARIF